MRHVMSVSNEFLPAFTMHRDMCNINPKKELREIMKIVHNKRRSLLVLKAKPRDFSGDLFYYKGPEIIMEKNNTLHVTNAINKCFLDFTSGALPPVDAYFISPDPLSASKTIAEELVAKTSFAEAAYLYPSATATLAAALEHSRNFQSHSKVHQPTMEYISLSNNIPNTSFPPKSIAEVEKLILERKVDVVFVEPIYGNGGIRTFTPQYLRSLRTACDKSGVLLAFDEVHCGLGQAGRLWAHQAFGVELDFMIVRFRGIDVGALLVNKSMNAHIHKYENEHIPRECGNALNIFRKVAGRGYLSLVTRKGKYLEEVLNKKLGNNTHVRAIRVYGLLVAMMVNVDAQSVVDRCKMHGLGIVDSGKGNIIRIMPPYTVNLCELDEAIDIIEECIEVEVLGGNDRVLGVKNRFLGVKDWVKPMNYYSDY